MKACSAIKKIELGRFFFHLITVLILPSLSFVWQGIKGFEKSEFRLVLSMYL